ncbi:MAG: ferredoxin [Actinomycetota bacterium]|nr:ferredoxin [Actinomycetota bacterium]
MALDVVVSRARCMASKVCLHTAEGVFRIVDDAATVVDVTAASEDELVAAAEACPVGAITVLRDGERIG